MALKRKSQENLQKVEERPQGEFMREYMCSRDPKTNEVIKKTTVFRCLPNPDFLKQCVDNKFSINEDENGLLDWIEYVPNPKT